MVSPFGDIAQTVSSKGLSELTVQLLVWASLCNYRYLGVPTIIQSEVTDLENEINMVLILL
jgi:hypothetical protein